MNIYELIEKTVGYMQTTDNELWSYMVTSAVTEEIIPNTHKPIKNFVYPIYKKLVKADNYILNPIYKILYPRTLFENASELLDYFKLEKECLITLKSFLNSNIDLPTAAYTGLFVTTIMDAHNINSDKYYEIAKMCQETNNNAYSVYIPDNYTKPVNLELVTDINTTVTKLLQKNKRL